MSSVNLKIGPLLKLYLYSKLKVLPNEKDYDACFNYSAWFAG